MYGLQTLEVRANECPDWLDLRIRTNQFDSSARDLAALSARMRPLAIAFCLGK